MSTVAGPSSTDHDYTEGASALDIQNAITSSRLTRRGSQYSMYGEPGQPDAALFSGPGHTANPSSVSHMAHISAGRRSSDAWSRTRRHSRGSSSRRALSRGSLGSRRSTEVFEPTDDEDDEHVPLTNNVRTNGRRLSGSPPPNPSMLDSLAQLFGSTASRSRSRGSPYRRRRSWSRRSSSSRSRSEVRSAISSEEEERWGYSSGEEDSDESGAADDISLPASMDMGSDPPSPGASQGIPLLATDPIFGGETRIDIEPSFPELRPPPPGPPSRQMIRIADEDITLRFVGYEVAAWRRVAWKIASVLTFGILSLLGHWFPRLWLHFVAREKAFTESLDGLVVIESAYRDITLYPVRSQPFPYHITSVFPTTVEQQDRLLNVKSSNIYDHERQMLKMLIAVQYRYSRFALDPRTGLFRMIRDWRDRSWSSVAKVQKGLSQPKRQQRLDIFGKNEVDVQGKSTMALLVDEVIHPFYVFQIASVILWSLDDYYYYAFCIALISAVSVGSTLIETKKTIVRMREMSHYSCQMDVLVDDLWVERESTELVPGDVVNLSNSDFDFFPADMFLLSGDAIVNESMLTGESVPVSKIPAKDEDLVNWRELKDENAKAFLYAGTRIVRIRGPIAADGSQLPALAFVTRTGFNTTKGSLVRSMLYPKPIGFKFYRDSVRFIGVLAGIALLGFCSSAVEFVRMGLTWTTILVRALDLITVVVPPALPATLSIGTSFAITRLRKLGIFCISPSRVNISGKINVCCFDKTGTLTEDGLDILGVRGLDRSGHHFDDLFNDVRDMPLGKDKATLLHAMATCHSLKVVDGEVMGDPLDERMFSFTKWILEEGRIAGTGAIKDKKSGTVVEQTALVQTVVRPPGSADFKLEDALKSGARHAHFLELGVIRSFEFVSQLRRMSVVVKRLRSKSMEVYVKGAPEVMADICDKSIFPRDYDKVLAYYTHRGYRVIAIAGKSVEGLTWLKAQRLKREQAESDLQFLGLVVFENKLKPGTTPAIRALRSAHLACRMITGDNPLTAVSVARECGLINQAAYVFAPMFVVGGYSTPESKLEWTCMDDPTWKLDDYSLKPSPPMTSSRPIGQLDYQDYALVLTGDVFRWMVNYAALETLQRMLVKAQIFSRMSPDEKNEVVERLQSLGYTVLMCGDGANDCAALKSADVGISLSEAEASIAAPFTSSTPDIGCVLDVIKEGRAALVTSFSCFKYMALYSLIQFTSVTLLYSLASSLGDFQFLYIDLFIIIPVAVAMARTLPYPQIDPKRPTANLVSKKVLASIIGQIAIASAFQLWAYLWVRQQEWYAPPPPASDPEEGHNLQSLNYENTVLFLISCFQYVVCAAVFSIGPPFRKSMWTNGWLMASMIVLLSFNTIVLLQPPAFLMDLLTLMPLPTVARLELLVLAMANVAVSVSFEQWGARFVANGVGRILRWLRDSTHEKQGKVYKYVEVGMR